MSHAVGEDVTFEQREGRVVASVAVTEENVEALFGRRRLNLSSLGMVLESDADVRLGASMDLRLQLGRGGNPGRPPVQARVQTIEAKGMVVWLGEEGRTGGARPVGIRFWHLRHQDWQAIAEVYARASTVEDV